MLTLYQSLIFIHAASGLCGLIVFWWPIFNKKGNGRHKRVGLVFANAMLITGGSGLLLVVMLYMVPLLIRSGEFSAEDKKQIIEQSFTTAHLLLMLAFLLLANVRQAVLTLRAKDNRSSLRKPGHQLLIVGLALSSVHLAYLAATEGGTLYAVFSVLGLVNAVSMCRYSFKAELRSREWLLQHIRNISAAGIGAHTAFLVFGARSFLEILIAEDYRIWLWIAPGALGGIAIFLASRHFSRKYRIGM